MPILVHRSMMLLAAVVLTVDGLDHERSGLLPWLADGTKNASSDPEVGHDPFALGTDTGSGCAQGTNPDQGLRIEIGNDGMTLGPVETDATWQVGIELRRIHRGKGALTPFDRSAWRSTDSTLTIDHGTYAIEYINNSDGLRQNFIVREEPPGDGPLQVELRSQGDLECVHAGHDAFHFVDTDNVIRMRYADLHVWDAQGDTLEAFAELVEGSIVLTALDADAVYPITVDPLASTAIWTTESNLNNAQLGTSVSSAGDVNGDGYSDILVGSPVWSNGQVGEGRVQLHYGGPNGLAAAIGWSFETNVVGANLGLGTSVATAGDVNGDGFSDIIVGAPYLSNGQTNEGRVYVFHGSATGPSATPDWMTESDQASALFGYSVNCAGDVNGDGYSDVVVGAYRFSNGQTWEGRAFVYHGSATGLPATANWTAESNQAAASFGFSVACAGDVNGDGFSDVIVGAPLFDNGQTNEGRAFVYHGSATGLAATAAWTTESNQASSQTGYSVSTAGDHNGDGYSDVLVGIPFYASLVANDGRIVVHTGSAAGLSAAAYVALNSSVAQAEYGRAVACAGDLNSDGFADLIIGGPAYGNGQVAEGEVVIHFGGRNPPITNVLEKDQAGAGYGTAVASAGDVNGDGFSDVIAGAPLFDNGQTNEGACWVFIGSGDQPAPIQFAGGISHPSALAEHFGQRVAGAGDVNGDGYSDMIVGDRKYGATNAGAAFVYHGSATGMTGAIAWSHVGSVSNAELGHSVASAGDVNGDGYSDVIVGAPFHTQSLSEQGLARVFLGSPSGLSTVASWTAVGGIAGAHFGYSVASAGDVNGDGYADVLVGVPDEPSTGEGRVHVFHGGPSGLSTTPAVVMLDFANGSFGESVATAGDVNGDGYSDVVIGEGNANMMHFFYGSASGLTATTNFLAFQGGSPNDYGSSDISGPGAISAGDVNGDGYSDVIVGARLFAWPLTDEGMARCFHGSASTPLNSWTRYGGVAGGWFGVSVSSAGDVDGDGYSDVIVGGCQTNGGGRYAIYAGSQGGLGASPSTNFTVIGSGIELGHSVCSLGDVNGDGYGDVAVSRYADGTGKVDVLLGNWNGSLGASGSNRRHNLRLYNTDLTTPISAANIPIPQFGAGLFTRPFLGRGKTRMVWETRIQGQPFSTAGGRLDRSVAYTAQQGALTAGAVAGVELKQLIDKPIGTTAITATKVRTRVRYDPVTAITGQVFGPWRYMPGYQNGTGTHNNVPLPVELLYFEAVCEGSRVALEWATGSEQESDHFIVERSMVTDQWQSIATIDAAGHSQATITYRFVDDAPPQSAVSYYRLIQVDQDGSTNVLRTIAAPQCASTVELTVFPNPTGDRMSVVLPRGLETAGAWLELRDATGRTLVQWNATGTGNSMDLDLGTIHPGWYHLELNDGSGRMLGSAPVIKQ